MVHDVLALSESEVARSIVDSAGCQYLYTVGQKSDASTAGHRRLAVTLYLEGLGVRSMSDLRV